MKKRRENKRSSAPKKDRKGGKKLPQRPHHSSHGIGLLVSRFTPSGRWRRLLIIGGGLTCIAAIVMVFQIDARVRKRIFSGTHSNVPAIYSAPLDLVGLLSRLQKDEKNPKEFLLSVLSRRRYLEITDKEPSQPGEYSLVNDSLTIVTREFKTPAGEVVPSKRSTLPLSLSNLVATSSQRPPQILLEPEIISVIGSNDVRASTYTPLSRIPKHLQLAVLAIEDERFYSHFGLDLVGIARALATNIASFRLVQGGSTLTQQLAKNLVLSPKRKLSRKLMEIPAAISLEIHLTKDQILELYLNEVYLGQEGAVAIHGTPEASQTFFGKRIEQLTLAEAATLAGMIKAPSVLSPRKYAKKARTRRDTVLVKMKELGYIDHASYEAAVKTPLKTIQHPRHKRTAPYFVAAIEQELEKSVELSAARSSGVSVYTGLELGMQQCAEAAITNNLAKIEAAYPRLKRAHTKLQGALVAIEPYSGLVKAWVGGRDFSTSQFDRVNQGNRQIGSTVKPLLYLTALDGSLNSYKVATATSILEDKPMEISLRRQATWIPENYDHDFRGDVTLRYALENSLNMPAIYVVQRVGIPALARSLEKFGLGKGLPKVPALALGAVDATLLQLTSAYGALANSGVFTHPRLFTSARDEDNDQLATSTIREEVVADENAVYVLTSIMEGVLDRGTGKGARAAGFSRAAAGKTGTSNDARDAWFIGFTPNLVAGVWVGLDDNSPLGLTGGGVASPIWGEFMKCASPYFRDSPFVAPRGIIEVSVDSKSGQRAGPDCPPENIRSEVYIRGTEPQSLCLDHSSEPPALPPPTADRIEPRLPEIEEAPKRDRSFWDSLFE
jgi:penicillin-binding protein 1B